MKISVPHQYIQGHGAELKTPLLSADCKVAAVTVLFQPPKVVADNVASCFGQVDVHYIVDNSEEPSANMLDCLPNSDEICRLESMGNSGIARALNLGAERALSEGLDFLLTMDQDSWALPGMVEALMAGHGEGIGLVAPFLLTRPGQTLPGDSMCRSVQTAMTSGSLLNLEAYQKVGPFRDDFFIDFVDIEYCLRLKKHGYKVLQADAAHLEHHVGRRIGKGRLSVTTHPPLRKYYKTRNRFQVWKEYGGEFPGYIWRDRLRFLLELGRLLFFEPEKQAKLRMMWRGWQDYRAGRFGKYKGNPQ